MRSAQLVSVMSLIWQHVSTLEGYLQASSIKYIKGIVYNCVVLSFELKSQFYSFIKYVLLCQISCMQEQVKMV
jgi:hypothetical protein